MKPEIDLPPLLSRFVVSMNHQDATGFLACFSAGAIVEDEGKTHRGLEEIKTWIEAAFVEARPWLEVTEFHPADGGSVITGIVSGTFPGSPVVLHYHLTHDANQISGLRCTV
jgi:hypothetical protein